MSGDGEKKRKRRRRRRETSRDGSPSPSSDANPEQATEAVDDEKGRGGVAIVPSGGHLTLPDYEFGWHKNLFIGINGSVNIMASVRDQWPRACALCAILSAAEQDILRNLAIEEPDRQPDIYFDSDTYHTQYEVKVDALMGQEVRSSKEDKPIDLLKIFERDGVRAYSRSGEWSGGKMIKISEAQLHKDLPFPDFENIIASGRPIVGGFPVGEEFMKLGPDEIYEFSPVNVVRQPVGSHMVLFVGTGTKGGREFLAFLNSKGIRFGKKGVGKVYFDQLYRCVYKLECRAPPPPLPSGNSDLMAAGPDDNDHTLGSSGAASDGNMSNFSSAPDGDNAPSSTAPTRSLSQAGKSNRYGDDQVSSSCAIEIGKQLICVDGWVPTAPAPLDTDIQTSRRAYIVTVERISKSAQADIPSSVVHVRSRGWPLVPRYRVTVSTQSSKVEMIDSLFKQLDDGNDAAIIIIRDGVSESQFSQVLNAKLNQVIKAYQNMAQRELPKVIIAPRNHHTEILQSDTPDNVPSGTAVRSGDVHHRHYALYICDPAGRTVSKNQNGRKHNQAISSSGAANSFGTMNTTDPFPSLASSTPSTDTPGDTISMSLMRHNASISSPLAVFSADTLGTRESQTKQIVDMGRFLEDGCLEDKVDLFLPCDDAEGLRDPRSRCRASTKGFAPREISSARASAKKSACFHFSSDRKLFAAGGHAKKQGYSTRTFTGQSASVMSLDFYPNKVDLMCYSDGYSEIIFWSINNGSTVHGSKGDSSQQRLQPHLGGYLAGASENVVSLLDVKTQASIRKFEGGTEHVDPLCWDSGECVVSTNEEGTVKSVELWRMLGNYDCRSAWLTRLCLGLGKPRSDCFCKP